MEAVGSGAKTDEKISGCASSISLQGALVAHDFEVFPALIKTTKRKMRHFFNFVRRQFKCALLCLYFIQLSSQSFITTTLFSSKLSVNRMRSCKQQILKVTNVTRGKANRCRERDHKDRNNEDETDKGKKMKNI